MESKEPRGSVSAGAFLLFSRSSEASRLASALPLGIPCGASKNEPKNLKQIDELRFETL